MQSQQERKHAHHVVMVQTPDPPSPRTPRPWPCYRLLSPVKRTQEGFSCVLHLDKESLMPHRGVYPDPREHLACFGEARWGVKGISPILGELGWRGDNGGSC